MLLSAEMQRTISDETLQRTTFLTHQHKIHSIINAPSRHKSIHHTLPNQNDRTP
jgi:hypothetical protein